MPPIIVLAKLVHLRLLEYLREFCLTLEGLFRKLPASVKRNDGDLVSAIERLFNAGASEKIILERFREEAYFFSRKSCEPNGGDDGAALPAHGPDRRDEEVADALGDRADVDAAGVDPAAAPQAGGVPGGVGQDAAPDRTSWGLKAATLVMKVGRALQQDIGTSRLNSCLVEWCKTRPTKAKAVAYLDCIVKYGVQGNVIFQKDRKPEHNIYFGLHTNILTAVDPVLSAAEERVERFYEQTFWSIPQAFEFGRACQSLAQHLVSLSFLKSPSLAMARVGADLISWEAVPSVARVGPGKGLTVVWWWLRPRRNACFHCPKSLLAKKGVE